MSALGLGQFWVNFCPLPNTNWCKVGGLTFAKSDSACNFVLLTIRICTFGELVADFYSKLQRNHTKKGINIRAKLFFIPSILMHSTLWVYSKRRKGRLAYTYKTCLRLEGSHASTVCLSSHGYITCLISDPLL